MAEKHIEQDRIEQIEFRNPVNPAIMILLIAAFVVAGITAPILVGQNLARALTAIGITSHLTIWLVPASPVAVVYAFWKLFGRLGIRI